MIENFNPFISLGGDNQKVNHMAEAALEMNLTCNDLKKDLNLTDGDVVDMLQFPLVSWNWPDWMPWVGGEQYTFFQYVFNIADTAISIGAGIIIVFNKTIFGQEVKRSSSQKA